MNQSFPTNLPADVGERGAASPVAAAALRAINLLVLALPLGGLTFFGIFAAPAMFRVARAANAGALAPQMVAQMLSRFGVVLIACTLIALVCWALDRPRGEVQRVRAAQQWWLVQGVASLAALAAALVLHLALMPRILAMQGQVLGASSEALRASFDAAHAGYSRTASFLLWATLASLICMARRSVRG